MNINRENYEVYFLDYLEGNLSAEEVAELLVFVQENPDLKEEFDLLNDDLPMLDLPNENIFPDKDSLKRSAPEYDQDAVNYLFAKKLEGDLSPREEEELNQLMDQHRELDQQWKLFARLRLSASEEEFLEKHSLKPIDLASPEVMMAAGLEGDLTASEKEALELLLQDEDQLKSWKLMQKTKVSADHSVVFFGKDQLKKKAPVRFTAWRSMAAAAAVFLIFFTVWQNVDQVAMPANSIAQINSTQIAPRPVVSESPANVWDLAHPNAPDNTDVKEISDTQDYFASNDEEQDAVTSEENIQRIEATEQINHKVVIPEFASLTEGAGLQIPKEIEEKQQQKSQTPSLVFAGQDDFLTVKAFVTQKARKLSRVGDDTSMSDGLMAKALETLSDKTDGEVQVDFKKKEDASTGWKLKIGKLELSHKKAG